MADIKVAFFDIDGTMVSFNTHRMSDGVYNALHRLQENGVKTVVLSGRPTICIDNIRDVKFDLMVGCNGGMAFDRGKMIFSHPIQKEQAIKTAETATRLNIPTFVFCKDVAGINCMNERSQRMKEMLNFNLPPMCDILELSRQNDVYEFTSYVTLEEEEAIFRGKLQNVSYIRWHELFTDINPAGIDKGVSVNEILGYLGYDRSQAIAFGDGGNDTPMLRAAGIGVAMGNAADQVKAAADIIAPTVDEDGVVRVLEELELI